jgi:hypothetical protein
MRHALLLPLAAALLAPLPARADPPPRVSVRLDFQRGAGAAGCPGEGMLRDEVARRMGYDPFDSTGDDWLHVVLTRTVKGLAATIDRNPPSGKLPWHEVFPFKGFDCQALIVAVSPEIAGILEPAPSLASVATPPEPVPELRAEQPAPAVPELPAVQAPPAAPAAPSGPPGHHAALGVAIASYTVALIFAGLGVAYTVKAQQDANAASMLRNQVLTDDGNTGCLPGGAAVTCKNIHADWQAFDTAAGFRDAWFTMAGATAAVGVAATVWSVSGSNAKPGRAQVGIGPGNLTIRGTF